MNPETASPLSIRWTLRYLEWAFLGLTGLRLTSLNRIASGPVELPEPALPVVVAIFTALALLSLVFPISRPYWQRFAYVFLEILLLSLVLSMSVGFAGLLLPIVIVKSCFLLDYKGVTFTIIVSGLFFVLSALQRFDQLRTQIFPNLPQALPPLNFILLDSVIFFLQASIFAVLLSFAVIAEQKSRQKTEALTRQVETLAASLERTRIARDIHDSLGHTLTTLDVQLELAQKLRQRNPPLANQALDTAKYLASQALTEVRRALQTMRQSNFNLNTALQALVEQVQQGHPFKLKLALHLPSLPLQTGHHLYCIVQEGLTNIQKHARAAQVSLSGWSTVEQVQLELADDGQGFDPHLPRSGFGLLGMQERVQSLGGQLEIDSAPGQGTRIRVVLPR